MARAEREKGHAGQFTAGGPVRGGREKMLSRPAVHALPASAEIRSMATVREMGGAYQSRAVGVNRVEVSIPYLARDIIVEKLKLRFRHE